MIKRGEHIRLRHSLACRRVIEAIDNNPTPLIGLKIPPKEVIVNDNSHIRNVTLYGLFLSFLLKLWH
jgi:hypothetical protein